MSSFVWYRTKYYLPEHIIFIHSSNANLSSSSVIIFSHTTCMRKLGIYQFCRRWGSQKKVLIFFKVHGSLNRSGVVSKTILSPQHIIFNSLIRCKSLFFIHPWVPLTEWHPEKVKNFEQKCLRFAACFAFLIYMLSKPKRLYARRFCMYLCTTINYDKSIQFTTNLGYGFIVITRFPD